MAEEINLATLSRAAGKDNIRQEIQSATETSTLTFTAEERRQIDRIKSEIDLTDSVTAVEYGIGCQRTLAQFADRVLDNSGKGSADTAEQLHQLIEEIKALDAGIVFKDTFWARLPLIGSRARRMKKLKKRFSKARIRIERLEQQLDRSRMELLRGAELFDMLGQENAKCFRQLTLFIQAGNEQLEYHRTITIPKLSAEVQRQNDPMAAQLLYGFEENLARFESRIHDLELSRTIALQSAPQMKLIQTGKRNAFVLEGIRTSCTAVAAAFVSSEQLLVYENFVCGADISGQSRSVTRTHKNRILRVDGKNGTEWYSGLLERSELEKDPDLSLLFPVVREAEVKIPFFVDYEHSKEGGLKLSSELPKGSEIYSGYFNSNKTLDEMRTVYNGIEQSASEILFAYDCQSRMIVMHSCAKWETEQFSSTNISGALLSGEIVSRGNKNYYANFTFAIACLSENPSAHIPLRSRDFNDPSPIAQNNIKAVNYLLASSNKQLNEQLEDQQNKLKNSLFRNEALGLDNQFCYLYDREHTSLDKIAMYNLTNEKMVKLFVGRKTIFDKLKLVYADVCERLEKRVGGKNIHIYSYEALSLLIAADSSIDPKEFENIARETLEHLNNITLNDVQLSYQCAVVGNEKEPLHKAETALQFGAERNIPFVKYNRIADSILDTTEEIHILQVIRDALSEERIIPYFQGIYDNSEKQFGLYESLMRIADKDGKIYYPDKFLPVAKKYNLYEMLSVVMVKKVMQMFVDSDVRVSINLNVRDLYDREMIKVIFSYLDEAAHPENFVFELVESEAVTDYCYLKQFADKIHEKHAKIAIDDFGSGFSNLMHILRIDADYLKIDGEIVRMICDDEKSMQFVSLLSSWCSTQETQVIAEYVENSEIQKNIENMGISFSQGYLFSKPQPWQNS